MLKCFNKQADSEQAFGNYCAIMMSECLMTEGLEIKLRGHQETQALVVVLTFNRFLYNDTSLLFDVDSLTISLNQGHAPIDGLWL